MGKSPQGGEGPDAAPLCEKKTSEEAVFTLCLVQRIFLMMKPWKKQLKKLPTIIFLSPRYVTCT